MTTPDDKSPKPDHAPMPQPELRPDGNVGAAVDRQAFADRQAEVGQAEKAPLTPEQRQQDRLDRLRASIGEDRDEAFNNDRPIEPEKRTLSQEFNPVADPEKGGIDP